MAVGKAAIRALERVRVRVRVGVLRVLCALFHSSVFALFIQKVNKGAPMTG